VNETTLLQSKAIKSGKWAFLARFSQILGGSLVLLVLPYWLVPKDFGIITIFTSVLALILILQQPGLMESIIQFESNPIKVRDSALWLSVFISLILYLVVFISSPIIEKFFNQKDFVFPFRIIALQIILLGFTNIPMAWFQRNFLYKTYAIIQLVSSISMIMISILSAILGLGYWSYIYGVLGSAIIRLLLVICLSNWRPSLNLDLHLWGIILKFGVFVLLEMILGWFLIWFDNVAVAKNLGSEAAGIYALAFNIATTSISLPLSAITGITLPTFSRLQNNIEALRSAYFKGTKIIATFCIPAGIGLSIIGPTLINAIYPGRWAGLGVILSVLALYAGFGNLWILNTDAFKAIGKPQTMLKIYVPTVLIMIPLYWWGSKLGLFEFSIIRSFVVVISAIPHCYFAIKSLHLATDYLWKIIYKPIIASIGMLLVVWPLNYGITFLHFENNLYNIISVLLMIIFGVIIYSALIKRLDNSFMQEFLLLLKNALKKEIRI